MNHYTFRGFLLQLGRNPPKQLGRLFSLEASKPRLMQTRRIEGQRRPIPSRQRTEHGFPRNAGHHERRHCRQASFKQARRNRWMGSLTVVSLRLLGELGQAHDLLPLLHLLPRRSLPGFPSPNSPVPLLTFLKRKVRSPCLFLLLGPDGSVLADGVPIYHICGAF